MHQFRAVVYFFIALANLVLTAVLVKYIGIIGAPIGTGLAMLIGNTLVINWYYQKKVGLEVGRFFKEVYLKLAPAILGALFICFVINYFLQPANSWLIFMVKAIVVGVIYIISIWTLGMNTQEKAQILALRGGKK